MKSLIAINRFSARRAGALAAALLLMLPLAASTAQAHKVTVFAWVEGDTVYTQSKFAGGRHAKGARLEVYDAAGEKLLEGLTDDQGRFAFKPPRPEALRIVLVAGSGHRGEWRLAAEEFSTGDTPPLAPPAPEARPSPAAAEPGPGPSTATVTLTVEELQLLVESSLEKKLAPVLRRLEQQADGPALTEIIGGIGYILGLVGLGAYISSRRKSGAP